MDEERFDRWTARLGKMLSRRGLGRAAVGAASGLALLSETHAKKKKKKKEEASNDAGLHPTVCGQELWE